MSRRVYGIKKANEPVAYDVDKARELAKCARDPIYFIKNYVKTQHPILGFLPFKLYDYQEEMIRSFMTNTKLIVRSGRQTGKTVTVCSYLLWFAMFNEHKTVLCVSKDADAAKVIVNLIQKMYLEVPDFLKCGVADDDWNKHTAKFDNGSMIVSLATSETAGRGRSISLLYADEIAFVRPAIQELFWTSIQPTLSTGGSCIVTSTPNGDTDLFSKLWRGAELGANDFKYIYVPWNSPPGRDDEFKRKEIANIGERKWRQEYECEFITSEGTLVDDLIIKNLKKIVEDKVPVMEIAGEKLWVNINPRRSYIIACDPGTGTGLDNSAIQVVEFPTMVQVLESATNTLDSATVYSKIKNIARYITSFGADVFFCFEQNGVGEGIAALYTTDEQPIEAVLLTSQTGKDGKKRLGYVTDIRNKVKFCLRLKKVIESEILKINSVDFLVELQRFVRDGHTYSAQPGATDDRIMAMILVLRAVEQMAEYDENAYTICYSFHNEQQEDWNGFHNKPEEEDDLLPLPMFG
jgi:hypothetical protein